MKYIILIVKILIDTFGVIGDNSYKITKYVTYRATLFTLNLDKRIFNF